MFSPASMTTSLLTLYKSQDDNGKVNRENLRTGWNIPYLWSDGYTLYRKGEVWGFKSTNVDEAIRRLRIDFSHLLSPLPSHRLTIEQSMEGLITDREKLTNAQKYVDVFLKIRFGIFTETDSDLPGVLIRISNVFNETTAASAAIPAENKSKALTISGDEEKSLRKSPSQHTGNQIEEAPTGTAAASVESPPPELAELEGIVVIGSEGNPSKETPLESGEASGASELKIPVGTANETINISLPVGNDQFKGVSIQEMGEERLRQCLDQVVVTQMFKKIHGKIGSIPLSLIRRICSEDLSKYSLSEDEVSTLINFLQKVQKLNFEEWVPLLVNFARTNSTGLSQLESDLCVGRLFWIFSQLEISNKKLFDSHQQVDPPALGVSSTEIQSIYNPGETYSLRRKKSDPGNYAEYSLNSEEHFKRRLRQGKNSIESYVEFYHQVYQSQDTPVVKIIEVLNLDSGCFAVVEKKEEEIVIQPPPPPKEERSFFGFKY